MLNRWVGKPEQGGEAKDDQPRQSKQLSCHRNDLKNIKNVPKLIGKADAAQAVRNRIRQKQRDERAAPAPYSAACRTWRAVGVRMVTSSSAAVGCSATVASKSALVAFIFTAIATAWMISAAVSP